MPLNGHDDASQARCSARPRRFRRAFPAGGAALVFLVSGVSLGVTVPARAESEPIRIDYRAAPPCPPYERFVAQVLRRAQRARLANESESARTFVIVIERRAAGFSGSLAIREGEQLTVARSVSARQCEEVAGALAFSTALAVDPTVPAESPSKEEPAGGANGTAPTESAAPAPATKGADANAASREPAVAAPADAQEGDSEQEPATVYAATPWAYRVVIGPALRSGSSPELAFGGTLALEAETPASVPGLALLGLEAVALRSLEHDSGRGASSYLELFAARPELCARAGQWSALKLMPCVVVELGLIRGEGADLPFPATARRFWAAVEVPLRAELALGGRWFGGASAGVVLPLTRYSFVFENPETSIYRIPILGFAGGVRLGLRL